jgi:tetratricopeptide (TPR) repeat protein
MDTQWTQRVVDRQFADVYCCVSCGHVHRIERYSVPMRFPAEGRCANCGADQQLDGREPKCTACGKTAKEDRDYHDKLASLHPSKSYLKAAEALHASGRNVLALKLATAEVMWGEDPVAGMFQRLQILESMDQIDHALDESYEWSERPGAPVEVFGVIAQLEAGAGNLTGSMTALERGLKQAPERGDWWCDLAEIGVHNDDRPFALRAAAKAMADKRVRERCLNVIVEIGERYYASEMYAEALSACSLAQDQQEAYFPLAWLRARIAASQNDQAYLVKWLEVATTLDPEHAEANAMLEPYRKKGSWFGWGKK